MKVKRAWRPPRDLDTACHKLCVELNKLPGITTDSSCEGHGRQPPCIWLHAASIRALEPIARAVDPRYYGQPKNPWRLELTESDYCHDRVMFLLTCEGIPRRRQKHLDLLARCLADATLVLDRWTKEHWCSTLWWDPSCRESGYADVPAAPRRRRMPLGQLMIFGAKITRRRAGQWDVRRGKTVETFRTRKAAFQHAHGGISRISTEDR